MTATADRRAGVHGARLVPTVVGFTLRSCIPPKRLLGSLLPCAGALLFGLLVHAIDRPPLEAFARVAANGLFGLAVPIAALTLGDAVLGAEIRSGTFHFTWLSPTPAWAIVAGRWVGGSLVALVTIVPATALAAVIAGVPEDAGPAALAAAGGAFAYIAVFIAIGSFARRTAVWSLAFVFFVERLLGAAVTGIAQISPTWESRAAFLDLVEGVPKRLIREGIPVGYGALGRLALISALALALATWRLRRARLAGAAD